MDVTSVPHFTIHVPRRKSSVTLLNLVERINKCRVLKAFSTLAKVRNFKFIMKNADCILKTLKKFGETNQLFKLLGGK